MEEDIEKLKSEPRNVTIQALVVINNFGSEDLSYIDDATLEQCFMSCGPGLERAIRMIHFNEERPENQNVRLKSLKRKTAEVRNNGAWDVRHLTQTIEHIISKVHKHVNHKFINDAEFNKRMFDEFGGAQDLSVTNPVNYSFLAMGKNATAMTPMRQTVTGLLANKRSVEERHVAFSS
jgi:hypothetical protein